MEEKRQHYRQLDGLRGIAIFAVFLSHFLVPHPSDWYYFAFGSFGVRLFFVLSGFLITGILLRAKDLVEGGQSVSYTLKAFYFRRTLRIFCVYYAWLAFSALFIYNSPRLLWDFLYLSNFYDMLYLGGMGNQYWSLAVEEQFYLVWPILILFCRKKYLPHLLIGIVLGVMLIRLYLASAGAEYLLIKKFPVFCMDALALGSLVALMVQDEYKEMFTLHKARIVRGTLISGVCLIVIAMIGLRVHGVKEFIYTGFLHAGLALFSVSILIPALSGYRGWLGQLLSWRPLCYLGVISYGCYLFHLTVQSALMGFPYFQRPQVLLEL